jgi:hypothetical protein
VQGEQQEDGIDESLSSGNIQSENEPVAIDESLNLPIAIRKGKRATNHDSSNYVSHAMMEELNALRKNRTWELTHLPAGKKAVTCKWIYTIKQNSEGKIECYKAILVTRGYTHRL